MLADQKERAEHTQLLDLGRNDCGRVAKVGTVKLTENMIVERYSHVMHIVSNVEGKLQDGLDSIRERLARVAKIGDFGSSNDPAPEFSTNSMKPFQAGKTGYGLTIKPGQPQVKPGEQSAVEPSNHAGFQQKGYYQSAIRVRYAA